MEQDAEARVLKEASGSSYRKGGAHASIKGDTISKEAVMNKLHRLDFPSIAVSEKMERKTDSNNKEISIIFCINNTLVGL